MSETTNIGCHIRELRETSQIDKAAFASFVGLTEEKLDGYENGNGPMRAGIIHRVCDLFRTNLDEMIAKKLPDHAVDMARKVSDINHMDNETLKMFADTERIANELLEMRQLVKKTSRKEDE